MKNRIFLGLAFIVFVTGSIVAEAQTACQPPTIVFNRGNENIFNEEQEMHLGDVIFEYVQRNYRVINDEEVNSYVRRIGEKLLKQLPPSDINFQFFVIDLPTLNAFAAPGGRIYVTRKMIAFVRSEAELAGILGHELGHGIVRHGSNDMSKYFKEILGVTSVTDRADIFRKYNQLISQRNTRRLKINDSHENNQQLEADRIGLFAMTAAGYDPNALVEAWDRLAETNGNTGGGFWGIFRGSNPNQKRLREIVKTVESLPAACRDQKSIGSAVEFSQWQSFVTSQTSFERAENLPALLERRSLQPALRADIKHFQFSPDGNLIIAQDDSGINVLRQDPFGLLFRIDTRGAKFAKFSPDSKQIVFSTYDLRVERWDVARRTPVFTREIFVRGMCWQTELSPDGKTLACYSGSTDLDLIDIDTNEVIYRKKEFYRPSALHYLRWSLSLSQLGAREVDALQMEFSPDGRYFLGGAIDRGFALTLSSYGSPLVRPWNEQYVLAYDITSRSEVKIGGALRNVLSMPYAFFSNDKVIGQHSGDPEKSGIFSFPDGKQIERFLLSGDSYSRPFKGNYIFVRPTTASPVGVYDIDEKRFISANKTPAMDGFGDHFVSESKDGVVGLFKLDRANKQMQLLKSIELPRSRLSAPQTVSVSSDLGLLAVSEGVRGGVWDLRNGEMKVYIRGFNGSHFDSDQVLYANFPQFEKEERQIGMFDLRNNIAGKMEHVPPVGSRQLGGYFVRFRTKAQEDAEQRARSRGAGPGVSTPGVPQPTSAPRIILGSGRLRDLSLTDGNLEFYDVATGSLLWKRYFPNEAPMIRVNTRDGSAALFWLLSTKTAQAETKRFAALSERLKALGSKVGDYYVQILDAKTGSLRGHALLETGDGSFSIENIFAAGNWLTVLDSRGRVLVYSLSDGELIWTFFGEQAALDVKRSVAIVENVPGTLGVYSLETGALQNEISFRSDVVYAGFDDAGARLFVLTSDQSVFIFDAAKLSEGSIIDNR